MKHILFLILTFALLSPISSESVGAKASSKRVELLKYLRFLEPIVLNYKTDDTGKSEGEPAKDAKASDSKEETDRYKKYQNLKSTFQEGLIYYFEGNYPLAFRRFLETQVNTEQLLEDLSQYYIETTDLMLQSALGLKDMKDDDGKDYGNKDIDKSLVDISVNFGKGARVRDKHNSDTESPMIKRRYEEKEYHYVLDKNAIEENAEFGYRSLGLAKKAKIEALLIEKSLDSPRQRLQPDQRKLRIEKYIAVILRCREARANAVNIFKLKYPYDNEYLQKDEKTSIEGVAMNQRINPYVDPKNLNPVFDKRIPKKFRKDAADIFGLVYEEEINESVKHEFLDVYEANRQLKRNNETDELPQPAAPKDKQGNTPDSKQPTPAPSK